MTLKRAPKKKAKDAFRGERLRIAREKRNLTQTELAFEAGCTQKDVSRAENGRLDVGASRIRAFCIALGISADHLLGLDRTR